MGDLGKVAQELSSKRKVGSGKLSVRQVFDTLRKIADFTGDGTVENKTAALVSLLSKSSGIEAKHLVRIPLGTSRLGIGDPTVLDAFAKAKLGDKSKRKLLEGAYNKVSDLGLIGETLWKGGLKAVEKLDLTVGRPLRSQLAERINDPKLILEKFGGEAHVQYKYDGLGSLILSASWLLKGLPTVRSNFSTAFNPPFQSVSPISPKSETLL